MMTSKLKTLSSGMTLEPTKSEIQKELTNDIFDDEKLIECPNCKSYDIPRSVITSSCNFKKHEKEQGGSPSKTNSQTSFVGPSDSLSPPYFEHIEIKGVQ